MTKKEFLAMSLPHKVVVLQNGFQYNLTPQIYKFNDDGRWNVKPILHSLSDLTKEIEHNGEKFVPIDKFIDKDSDLILTACQIRDFSWIPLNLAMMLIQWHFDIAGLIEKGEAIDVNTLPENPYK